MISRLSSFTSSTYSITSTAPTTKSTMQFFVVFAAALACACAQTVVPSGYIADAPDVALAKLAHFNEKAKAAAAAGVAPDYVTSYYLNYYRQFPQYAAQSAVIPSAYLADPAIVPEYYRSISPYVLAPAPVTVLPNGFLADTPEVAQARVAHLAEHAKAAHIA